MFIFVVPPVYTLHTPLVKAEAGERVSVRFSVASDPDSGDLTPHTLKKKGSDGNCSEHVFFENELVFEKVSLEDKGHYIISCQNDAGEGSAAFKLDVLPTKGFNNMVALQEVILNSSSL